MGHFIGMDLHMQIVQMCILDGAGRLVLQDCIPMERETLSTYAQRHFTREDALAVEATFNTWAIVDLLTPFLGRIVVSNPLQTKAIASAKVKTEKVDARILAELLRCDFLPEVWQPDAETRRIRSLVSRRSAWVADRTGIKNLSTPR